MNGEATKPALGHQHGAAVRLNVRQFRGGRCAAKRP